MLEASYILTYREGESPARRENLHAVLRWLAAFPMFEVVVVEQDDAPRLDGPLPHPRCTHLFAYNPGPFNKSWGYNVGFRHVQSNCFVFGDADVIVGDALVEALGHVRAGYPTVKPYRRLIDLDAAESAHARAAGASWLPARDPAQPRNREGIGEVLVYAGGVLMITRSAFLAAGGWDERFRGWGGEDDALSYILERRRCAGVELDTRPALHLWHERSAATTSGQPHYADNLALLAHYRELDDEALARFAEIQAQVIGHLHKYRPQ